MTVRLPAAAKVNLALLVGPGRSDGYHDVATVIQRIDICDLIEIRHAAALEVEGFEGDTLVRGALQRLAGEAGVEPRWRVRIEKRIPVAAGLGGGSADAAAALVLANRMLPVPVGAERLHALALGLGSDVPFFLEPGPKLAEGRGEQLVTLQLPQDYWTVVAIERGARKRSTADVYARFDELGGATGFDERRLALLEAVDGCRRAADLASLPRNDLAVAARRLEPAGHPPSRRRVSRRRERRRARELRALPDPTRRRGRDAPAPVGSPFLDRGTRLVTSPAVGLVAAGSRTGATEGRASDGRPAHRAADHRGRDQLGAYTRPGRMGRRRSAPSRVLHAPDAALEVKDGQIAGA